MQSEAAPTPADEAAGALLTGAAHPRDLSRSQTDQVRELVLRSHFAWMVLVMGAQDFMHYPVHGPMCAFIDKWGQPGWERLMVQVTRDIGKCLHADTLVHTPRGPMRAGDLTPGDKVYSLSESWRTQTEEVVANSVRRAPLVEVRLRSGTTLLVTPHHKLRRLHSWQEARLLRPGDEVVCPREIPRAEKASPGLAYLAGIVAGDGCFRRNKSSLSCRVELWRDDLKKAVFSVTGPLKKVGSTKATYSVPAYWYNQLPTSMVSKSVHKTFPLEFEGSAEFLRGLFDTDGCVEKANLTFCSASEELARGVHRNLRYFGVVSKLSGPYRSKGPNGFVGRKWVVIVSGKHNLVMFRNRIWFFHKDRAAKLDALISRLPNRSSCGDAVPPAWRKWIAHGSGKKGGPGLRLKQNGIHVGGHSWTSWDKFREAAYFLGHPQMLDLADANVWFDRVVSVTPAGTGPIAELQVSGNQSYLADGVLHHNTTVCTRGNAMRQIALDPDAPVAIFNERIENAAKWFRVMRETAQSSAVFKALFPHLLPPGVLEGGTPPRGWKWNDHELQFQRGRWDIPEASITGLGIGAASTGGHWSKIIKDDIISKDAQDSPLVMSWAKDWFDKSFYLERPALLGWDLVVCTPWTHDDVYTHALKNYNYRLYRRGGMEDGKSIWEEKMPTRILLQHQARDPSGFSAQVMCQPTAGVEASFRKEWLHTAKVVWDGGEPYVYHSDERYDPAKSEIEEKAPRKVSLSDIEKVILLDPAPTEDSDRRKNPGARNAIVVAGCDTWGRRYILDSWAGRVDPEQVIDKLLNLSRQWGTTRIGIEEVVFSFLYRHWLRRIAKDRGLEVNVTGLETKGREKGARIQALINPCKAGWWHIEPSLGNFMQEYVEYPYGGTVDLLDAWAYSQDILHRPVSAAERLSRYWSAHRMDRTRDTMTGY